MAGHSKWSKIKRKKAVTDTRRGKLLTKLLREVQVAAKMGGPSPEGNPRLKIAIATARSMSVPNDNIDRAIKRGSGDSEGDDYEEITYEGYGAGGVAVLVKCLTDNRNRTASEVRHAFSKFGGSLGSTNSVAYLFHEKGLLSLAKEEGLTEQVVFEKAIEAGADDIRDEDDSWEIEVEPTQFETVRIALAAIVVKEDALQGEVSLVPATTVSLEGDNLDSVLKLIEHLEDLDDVQTVTTNIEVTDEVKAHFH
jgi:YebC/PmpR family DNA-binding regulatory protein